MGRFRRKGGKAGGVTGLTISPSQKGYADARLDGRAEIQLQDYRKSSGTYDNIVSIEMIEAVGQAYWPTYFATLKARLAEGGRVSFRPSPCPMITSKHIDAPLTISVIIRSRGGCCFAMT